MIGKKRTALVTGGTTGLGSAISKALAEEGHRIVATYFSGDQNAVSGISEWARDMGSAGHTVYVLPVDVSSFSSCADMVREARAQAGHIDILVNNAGITRDGTFVKMTEADWDAVINTNLKSVFNMTKQVIGEMIEARWGRIISISSVNGEKGQFGQANYAASKAGIIALSKSIAAEVARYENITVNAVAPGYMETQMVAKIQPDILKRIVDQIPVKRLGRPEEVGALVKYLASEDAGFVTGATFDINGGMYFR